MYGACACAPYTGGRRPIPGERRADPRAPRAGPPGRHRTVEGVYRFLLTPRWWGINVFVLLAIPFCIFMGSWQLSRFESRVQDHRTQTEQAEAGAKEAPGLWSSCCR